MSSPLEKAEQAVAELRAALVRRLYPWTVDPEQAEATADALVAAVRELAAREIERAEFQRGPIAGSKHYVSGYSDGLGDAARIAREGLPKETA